MTPLERLWTAQGRRFALWVPVLVGLGVQGRFLAPSAILDALAVVALLAGPVAAWRFRASLGPFLVVAAVLAVSAGYVAATVRIASVAAPVIETDGEMLIEGRVIDLDRSSSGRLRVTLDEVVLYGVPHERTPRRVRVVLLDDAPLLRGEAISVMGRLSPPAGPAEPGAFDFSRSAWFDGLGATGVARGRVARLDPPGDGRATGVLAAFRFRIADALSRGMEGEAGAFAAAVTVGDRSGLPQDAVEALRDSGLAHLLAISGLHMAMASGLVFVFVRLALVAAPGGGVRIDARRWAAAAALIAATGYLLLSGASVSTVRAYVIAVVAFMAVLLGRSAVTMRALALAACLILLATPESLFNVGFQMSFAATVALVAVYEVFRDRGWLARGDHKRGPLARIGRACAAFVLATALTSLVAGLATAPFAAAAFNRAALYSLPANLLGTPAMGLVVAPGLALAAITPLLSLGAPSLDFAGWGIDWILGVARMTAELPGAVRMTPAPPAAGLWLVTVGGLWLSLWRRRLRLLGMIAVAAGLAIWAAVPRPHLLIAPGGAAVGVLGPDGRAILATRAGAFPAEAWLRRDGDEASADEARAREGFLAEGAWSRAEFGEGGVVHVHLGPERAQKKDMARRCAPNAVIVVPRSNLPDRTEDLSACLVLDRYALSESAFAIDARENVLRVRTSAPLSWLGLQ